MRARCRAFDWSATPLGAVESWTPELKTTATVVLANGFPAIALWGTQLIQIYNEGYVRFLGVKHPQGLGMPTFECWPEVKHITAPIYARVLAGETVTNTEQLYSLANGGPGVPAEDVYVTISFAPIGAPGAVAGILITIIDVTLQVERRQFHSERERLLAAIDVERRRLAEIFRGAPTFVALLRGPDHTYEFVNDAYTRLIGHREVIGKSLLDALPEVRGQGFKELLDRVRDTGVPWVGSETPVRLSRTPDAPPEMRYLDMVFQPFVEADGTRSGVVAHGYDVTGRMSVRLALEEANETLRRNAAALARQAEELKTTSALRERAVEAEAASRAKTDFLAVMSHELRTPLNVIGGYTQLLELGVHGAVTAEQRTALDRIQQSQRHLLGLINGVLNYAKISAGGLAYANEDVDLEAVLAACDAMVESQARAGRLEYHRETIGSPAVARADEDKVQQILINLLSNAIKFTGSGGRISVVCGMVGGTARITVADSGCGIPASQLSQVFDPFMQVDPHFTREHEGIGLGLAISRDLARAMGGDLTVASTLGAGSVFTLTLPGRPDR
jgi:signal transduction histidine kinase/PAS domain-containing protein